MPEFQRKTVRFKGGIYWNAPIDGIPEDKLCYARNVRVAQNGTMIQRPGLTTFANLGGTFVHSISRLNNFNFTLINFDQVKIIGMDNQLYVGPASANLTSGAQNPVKLPPAGATNTLSGNPLTMVDMAPVGASYGWKYIGDSTQNFAVGYYPGDHAADTGGNNAGRARAMTMGMTPPVNTAIPAAVGGGLITGTGYQWIFAYRNKFTGARSNPSAPTRVNITTPGLNLTNQSANIAVPTTPIDPLTGAADLNILVDVYRFGGTIQDWRYVGSVPGPGGGTFNDNQPDAQILTNPGPPSITDPVTGVQRFNVYRPFITQDVPRYSTVNGLVFQDGTGKWFLQVSGVAPNAFNLNWLPGSTIGINNKIFSIFQVNSVSLLELVEDATGSLTNGGSVPWATATTLTAGAPMPHIWGPYGTGSGGAYIFGCGDQNSTGTLYWTNGNDPDSTDIANSLIVTSPSEPLRGGCVYDGTPFCWSSERMFRIYPGTAAGQFTVQEVPGGKGIWAEWSLTVQSNGIADQSVSWVGKDGIYNWSTSGGLECLTDRDLYPFFPHDNQPGTNLNLLFPILNEPIPVNAPSYTSTRMKYHRLCWYQGELFYDFPGSGPAIYNTLVLDIKEIKGWVSLDQYTGTLGTAVAPVCRGIEIAGSNLLIGIGGAVFNYTGINDAGSPMAGRVVTRQDDMGDPRVQKFLGDYMFDVAGGTNLDLGFTPLVDYGNTALVSGASNVIGRYQFIENFRTLSQPAGYLSRTVGFDITFTSGLDPVELYQYEFAFVLKPEFTENRPTDVTDDGYNGAKYLRGLCIECNTQGVGKGVEVWVDGAFLQTISVTANGQKEIPFAITSPIPASEFQLRPLGDTPWELFQVRWVWEKWPDYASVASPWLNLGTTNPKYLRGFSIPVDTVGTGVNFTVMFTDGGQINGVNVGPVTTLPNGKNRVSFAIGPFIVDQVQLRPNSPIRCWYDEIIWDAEEWPNLISEFYPWQNLGDSGAKYLRGFEVPVETGGAFATLAIRSDQQGFQSFDPVQTDSLVKTAFPFTPGLPMVGHEFQLRSLTNCRVWWQEIKWEFDPWPENSDGRSSWTDMGTPGAKFLQGMVIPMDTNGQTSTIDLLYDHGQSVPLGPFNTPGGQKNSEAYSLPTPIIVHEVQLAKRDNIRLWDSEVKWIWEPVPELVTTYTTQPTDHDLPGWHYLFDAYIAYIGTGIAPTLTVTTEYGTIAYPLPVANGTYTRAYVLLHPQKAKWRSYSIVSPTGLRLFLKDCEVRVKNWTDKGNYPASFQSYHPFGDESRVYGARI